MNRKRQRFLAKMENLSAQQTKVYDAAPIQDEWTSRQILAELQRTGASSNGLRQVEHLLYELENLGLLRRPAGKPHKWQKVSVPKAAELRVVGKEVPVEETMAKPDVRLEEKPTFEVLRIMSASLLDIAAEMATLADRIEAEAQQGDQKLAKARQLKRLLAELAEDE